MLDDRSFSLLARYLLEMGENMLLSGGETSRIEGTLERIGQAYGAERTNVFVIPSLLTLTLSLETGHSFSQSRRVFAKGRDTNFRRLEAYNSLSRELCRTPLPVEDLGRRISEIEAIPDIPWVSLLGHLLGAFAFTLFYSGSFPDALVAAAAAIGIYYLKNLLPRFSSGRFIYHLLAALFSGVIIALVCLPFPALHMDKILIGDIMLLIPGVALTSAVRDVLVGDTIAGAIRVLETVLWAIGLAAGFLLSLWIAKALAISLNNLLDTSFVLDPAAISQGLAPSSLFSLPFALLGSLGFALLYQPRIQHLAAGALGGLIAWGVYLLASSFLTGVFLPGKFLPCLLAAAIASLYAEIMARIKRAPSTIYQLPAIIPLVPGSTLYYTMSHLVVSDWQGMARYGLETLWFTLAIAAGITFSWALFYALRSFSGKVRKENGL